MKTVKITIEVDVPDWVKWIAVDADGAVILYAEKPIVRGEYDVEWDTEDPLSRAECCPFVDNWREILTKVDA